MICKKCGAVFVPPLLTHPNSHAYNYCQACHADYLNVLLQCGQVRTRITHADIIKAQGGSTDLKILEFSKIENHGANHKDVITVTFDEQLQIDFSAYHQTQISDKWHTDYQGGVTLSDNQAIELRDLLNQRYPTDRYPGNQNSKT